MKGGDVFTATECGMSWFCRLRRCHCDTRRRCVPRLGAAACVHSSKSRKLIWGFIPFINVQLPLQNTITEKKWLLSNTVICYKGPMNYELWHLLQARILKDNWSILRFNILRCVKSKLLWEHSFFPSFLILRKRNLHTGYVSVLWAGSHVMP